MLSFLNKSRPFCCVGYSRKARDKKSRGFTPHLFGNLKKFNHQFCKKGEGFTLIELLVVISIIGLLTTLSSAAVILYRNKARDARVEANLTQIRRIAAQIHTEYNSYESLCDNENTLNDSHVNYPGIKTIEDDVKKYNENRNVVCYALDNAYCVISPLTEESYCLDYTGYTGTSLPNCAASSICF